MSTSSNPVREPDTTRGPLVVSRANPFHPASNENGVGIGSIVDYQVLPLDPRVQAIQEAYIRKVVDTLHDLPNLLLQPSGADGRLTVMLEPGTYAGEWFSIEGREQVAGAATTVDRPAATSFSVPPEASGPVVLYQKVGW